MPRPFLIFFFAVLTIFASPVFAQTTDEAEKPGTISLQGVGEITAIPDMAIISSGVITIAKTARAALDANSAAMSDLFDVFSDASISENDIQTSNFSVQPQFVFSDTRDRNGYPRPPRIEGYQVSNTVSIKIRKLADLGDLLDASVSVGANQINAITFAVDDPEPLLNEARRAAITNAIAKANLYADAAGVTLGRILSISEAGALRPQFQMAVARSNADNGVPVAAGELTFSRQVSVVWEILQSPRE